MTKEIYEHCKGGLYELIVLAKQQSNGDLTSVYKSLESNDVWVRPFNEFAVKFRKNIALNP